MSRIRAKDTKPERLVRSFLHRAGFRFRLHASGLKGKPDIVLPKYRSVVFVNGCFWHGHAGCRRAGTPQTNRAFWQEKIGSNKQRDRRVARALRRDGWNVFVIWECQIGEPGRPGSRLRNLVAKLRENA